MADDDLTFSPSSPLVTTPAAEPLDPDAPPPRPINTAAITEARSRADEAMDRYQQHSEQEASIAREKERAMEPLRNRYMSEIERSLPQRRSPAQTPSAPQRNEPGADESWLMAAALLGALAGAFTRNHQTNALAAFTGAIQGYHEGSAQKFNQNMQIWEAEHKRAVEANQQAMDEYRAVLEDRKLTAEQRRIEFQLVAQKYDDQAASTAAQTKNDLVMAQYYDKRAQAAQQMEIQGERLRGQWEQFDRRQKQQLLIAQMRATGATNPEQMQAKIDAIGTYRQAPVPGRWGSAIMEAVADQYPGYDATRYGQKQAALRVFSSGIEGRMVGSLSTAVAHLEVLKGLGDALENHDIRRINQFGNLVTAELGYPAPTSFDAVKQVVSAEIMKSIVPGGGGVYERRELAQNVDSSQSPAQLNGVIRAWESLMNGQRETLKRRYEKTTGLTDFDDYFSDAAQRAFSQPFTPESTSQTTRRITEPTGQPIMDTGRYPEPRKAIEQGKHGVGVQWLPQSWIDREKQLGTFVSPAKAATGTPDMPIMLPEGWTMKELQ